MKAITSLLLLSLVCGVWKKTDATSKHFELVNSWTGMDFVFPDEATRAKHIADNAFVPGAAIPAAFAVESDPGRIFMAFYHSNGVPATLATVSETKNDKGENLMTPYPDWSWHERGCDGLTSVEGITIDECGRMWVMDTGVTYPKGATLGEYTRLCPPKILIFDLKTDTMIKKYEMTQPIFMPESAFATISVDVISKDNQCSNTFAYLADAGYYGVNVYDFAHDDAWRVYANEFYPYPEFGHFLIKGVHFDYMYGVSSLTLSPKHDGEVDRTLFLSSFASGKMSYLPTSLLKNKTNFEDLTKYDTTRYISSNIHTYPFLRPGGQTVATDIDSYGVMYWGSIQDSSIYCWNSKKEFDAQHVVMVDKDEEQFEAMYEFQVVMPESGGPELYMLSNNFQDFLFSSPEISDEIHFRIMKAPLIKMIEGTTCMSGIAATPTRK